jgi:hypothetical protein
MKCPHCGNDINIGSLLGSTTSKAKARAARRNAKLGGWPKGKKRGKRKKRPSDPNALAHSVVADAEKLTQQAAPPRLPEAG